MKQIELTRGKFAIVDDTDFEWLYQWKWIAVKGRNTFYAVRGEGIFPFRKLVFMHRVIMNTPDGMETDHQDHNGLNNQRYNLRNCTRMQNSQNQKIFSNNTSGYKGVTWEKHIEKWRVRITINRTRIHLGYFSTAKDAGHAYDVAAKKYFGEFAKINFPHSESQ